MGTLTAGEIIELVIAYLQELDDLPSWSTNTWQRKLADLEKTLVKKLNT